MASGRWSWQAAGHRVTAPTPGTAGNSEGSGALCYCLLAPQHSLCATGTDLLRPTLQGVQSCASQLLAPRRPAGCRCRRDPLGSEAGGLLPARVPGPGAEQGTAEAAVQLPAPRLATALLRLRHPRLWWLRSVGSAFVICHTPSTDTGPVIRWLASSADQDSHSTTQRHMGWLGHTLLCRLNGARPSVRGPSMQQERRSCPVKLQGLAEG